jgi:hypothetical protein
MRQFMKACLFAFTDIQPVVRADPHQALTSVSATASPATHNGYRTRVRRERGLEPLRLLNGMDVSCTTPIIYYSIILYKDRAG